MTMQAMLVNAQGKAEESQSLYKRIREEAAAGPFYPIGGQAQTKKQTITRAQYEAMPYEDRHKFFSDGGAVVDEIEQGAAPLCQIKFA